MIHSRLGRQYMVHFKWWTLRSPMVAYAFNRAEVCNRYRRQHVSRIDFVGMVDVI